MAERSYQVDISPNTLYRVRAYGAVEQIQPNIEVQGGDSNVYVSQEQDGSAPNNMHVIDFGSNFKGVASFSFLPNYLYVEDINSNITQIILSGIQVEAV